MAYGGLLKRKEVWLPTWRGWLALTVGLGCLAVGAIAGVVPFLEVTHPTRGEILVVEGWLPDYAIEEAKRVFEQYHYRQIVVTGIPIDHGLHISSETNYAQLAASTLRQLGVKSDCVVPVACQQVERNRTYATACKVKEWLESQKNPTAVDVLTLGVHARRTWLLYEMVLGGQRATGVFAAADQRFDSAQWWKSSNGFRTVTSEAIAYLYAKLLFYPRLLKGGDGSAL